MTILIPIAEGFEETEAVTVIDLLRRADLDVKTVSLDELFVEGAHGIKIMADCTFSEVDFEISSIVIPGGMPGTKNIAASEEIIDLIRILHSQNALIAAICAAPTVLSKAGILAGKRYTCYPGYEKEITEGIHENSAVVKDGNIITSMGPGTAAAFALEIIDHFCQKRPEELAKKFIYTI